MISKAEAARWLDEVLGTEGETTEVLEGRDHPDSQVFEWTSASDSYFLRVPVDSGALAPEVEAGLMALAREAGLPVPEVPWCGEIPGTRHTGMLVKVACGVPLSQLDGEMRGVALRNLGVRLRELHAVPMARFGMSDAACFRDMLGSWRDAAQVTGRLARAGIDLPHSGAERIVAALWSAAAQTPKLCHGDLKASHLFFDDQLRLSGIIDFGQSQGSLPYLDYAVWAQEESLPEAVALMSGSECDSPALLHAFRVFHYVGFAEHNAAVGDEAHARFFVDGIMESIASLQGAQ